MASFFMAFMYLMFGTMYWAESRSDRRMWAILVWPVCFVWDVCQIIGAIDSPQEREQGGKRCTRR